MGENGYYKLVVQNCTGQSWKIDNVIEDQLKKKKKKLVGLEDKINQWNETIGAQKSNFYLTLVFA